MKIKYRNSAYYKPFFMPIIQTSTEIKGLYYFKGGTVYATLGRGKLACFRFAHDGIVHFGMFESKVFSRLGLARLAGKFVKDLDEMGVPQ